MTRLGRTQCEYCTDDNGKKRWFTKETPTQRHCTELCKQFHEAELNGGVTLSISRNHTNLSDDPDFQNLGITIAESEEDKERQRVQRANDEARKRNQRNFGSSTGTIEEDAILYDFDGSIYKAFDSIQDKRGEITLHQATKRHICSLISTLLED